LVVLICILAILVLLFFLLLLPIRISLCYHDDLTVTVSYLFFTVRKYPNEKTVRLSDYTPRRVRKRRRKALQKQRIEKEKAALKKKQVKKKKSAMQGLRFVRILLNLIKEIYKPVISAVRIRVDRLYVAVATEDAAKTAILYGTLAQGTAYLLSLLESFTRTKINTGEVGVVADFAGSKTVADIKIRLLISPLRIAGLYLKTVWHLLKKRAASEEKNTENGEK